LALGKCNYHNNVYTYATISAKTRIVCTSMHIEKKIKNYLWQLQIYWNVFTRIDRTSKGSKKASNQQKLDTILLPWLWKVQKSLFCFHSLNSECVTCVRLQCDGRKQNCYRFLGNTATIDKCTVSLRVISIAYLLG